MSAFDVVHNIVHFILLAVHFGTCRYNSSETCPSNKTNCMSDGECETDQKCCNSSCGFKCMQSIHQTGVCLYLLLNYSQNIHKENFLA